MNQTETTGAPRGGAARNRALVCVCEGAVMTALSLTLSYLKFKLFPTGGSIDLVMIPLVVYSLRRGARWGVGAGLVFGTLKCILSEGVAYGWQAMILDYSLAYGLVGFSGLLRGRPLPATALGCALRYLAHVVSGVVLWGEWMPDEFLRLSMNSVWVYSLIYNATYMLPGFVIAAAAVVFISRGTKLTELK